MGDTHHAIPTSSGAYPRPPVPTDSRILARPSLVGVTTTITRAALEARLLYRPTLAHYLEP